MLKKNATLLGFPDYGPGEIVVLPGTKIELDGEALELVRGGDVEFALVHYGGVVAIVLSDAPGRHAETHRAEYVYGQNNCGRHRGSGNVEQSRRRGIRRSSDARHHDRRSWLGRNLPFYR